MVARKSFAWGGEIRTRSSQRSVPSVSVSGQPGCGQAHRDLMVMVQEIKKCLPEEKRSSGEPRTVSALNYALRCVQRVRANSEFFQALNDRRMFHTDVVTYSIEELAVVASEHTPKNNGNIACKIKRPLKAKGGKDQEQEMHWYPFRITPYLVHVCTSVLVDAESCCLALAEKIHSGYEGKSGESSKKQANGKTVYECQLTLTGICTWKVHRCSLQWDLIGTSILMYLHPEDRPLMVAIHHKILKFAGQPPFEYLPIRFCTQNGDYVILDTSWSSFVNPWSRKVVFIIGRHKVRTSPLNEDVFATRNQETSSVEKEIKELQGQIYKLLLQPVHSSVSSGYGSLGSSGSYEHYISIASSSDSNGNCAEETQEPMTLQQVCADVNRIKNLGQQLYIASRSKAQRGNEQPAGSEVLEGKRHSASRFLQTLRSNSAEEAGSALYDDSKTPHVPSYQQINYVDSIIRYLESCSIPLLKRKCKSSTNTSSSSSDGDKKNQQRLQEITALEGTAVLSSIKSQTPVFADQEEMLKKTNEGIMGAPLPDMTLSSKSPSVASATSQCSYSSTIVHVPHPESEVTTVENTPVGNEHSELLPVNAHSPTAVAGELKPVGLTKETLSAHTQKEEQNYVDKFRRRILLSPFRSYLQRDSRSNNGHSCGQGNSPSKEMTPASCKNGKNGKFKRQKPQRQSSDRRSYSSGKSSKYFGSNDSSETLKEEMNQEAKEKEASHKSKRESAWAMMDRTPEQVLMTYQMPNRIKEEVLKEDMEKLLVMRKQQPWFSDRQKKELAEVHTWIRTQTVPQQISTQCEMYAKNIVNKVDFTAQTVGAYHED
ncbi:UNVERIFIED_CONTAM: hypothetical protein H355_007233 [Colinus virginianus]|nr:hypothetical protein H355_007233 [Colinus virginianus]